MAKKTVDITNLWQRTDQGLTISKNDSFTQDSTSGQAITAYLYEEDDWELLTNGIDVTSGSPTGSAEDTNVALTLDTLTGIDLSSSGPKNYALVVSAADGTILLPNKTTAELIVVRLHPQPS